MSDKSTNPRFFYGYVVTAAGCGVWLICWGTFNPCFGVFLKPLLAEFGWTRAETALAYSLALSVQAALTIMMGWLTDRLGPRTVVTVFGSFLGVCYLLMSGISTIWQFQLVYGLVGAVGLSALNIPVMVTIARWFIKRRGLMIGIGQAGLSIGGLIFPPFTAWLILSYSWRFAYMILGLITLVGIIIPGLFFRRDPRDVGQLPDGVTVVTGPGLNGENRSSEAEGLSFGEAVRTSHFWMIAGIYSSFGFCRATFIAHIAAHVQDLGFSLADGANVLAVLTGASMIGRIGMGRVADMIGNRVAFMISFGITTVILLYGVGAVGLWELYLFGFVFGFAWGAQAVLRFAITSDVFGVVSLGLVMGVLGFAEYGVSAFGSYFAGYVFDVVGTYRPVFLMGMGVSTTGIILAWLLKPAMRN
jgi:MFS family permease